MSGEPTPASTNSLSKPQLPSFVEMLDVSQKNIIKNLLKANDLSISDKIDSIDSISKDMPKEARVEYRKWRFLMDRSRMPDFYDFQNDHIKEIITAMFEKYTDLEEFARIIMSIRPMLNNPDAFDKWMKNEEIEFKEPPIQEDTKKKQDVMLLINNKLIELARNINSLQIGGDNSFNDSHKILFYLRYQNNDKSEGRIYLFNSYTCSVEEISKFHNWYRSYEVATKNDRIFAIDKNKSFEIYDLNTRIVSRGPDPPEWRDEASVAYFKDKLYYLGGDTSRVDVLIDGQWQTGPAFPLLIERAQTMTCDDILYVIHGESRKIYRLSDDEREWIEIGKISKGRTSFGVALLNGKIYITGGLNAGALTLKSCLCFDPSPSAPVSSRISRIADMNYARYGHSLVVANGKLYAVGGFRKDFRQNFCNSIEEYDPQANEWREVGILRNLPATRRNHTSEDDCVLS